MRLHALIAGLGVAFAAATAGAADITGAGATFPYPIYAKWAEAYKARTGTAMNYQSIGSGGGLAQIKAKTVDFGASDMPLKPDELEAAGLVQFPAIIGGIVPIVNVDGVAPGALRLSGPVLADIYLGKVRTWNDKTIAALNPGLALPDAAIAVVHRSDGSGTTFNFTDYLAKVSEDWKTKVGSSTAVAWPTGVGGKGHEGVAAYVQRIKGAIGYVEYAYAKRNQQAYAMVRNREGKFPVPRDASFQAAAAHADWGSAPGYYRIITDSPGGDAWPIAATSFILMHARQEQPARAVEVLKFFDWSFRKGRELARELDYVPLPDSLVKQVEASWHDIRDAAGQPAWQP
jgi:phosphate transport system substrate-binding protein